MGISSKAKKRYRLAAYLFILPAIALIFVFMLYPLGYSFFLSFTDYNFAFSPNPKFIGLGNYIQLFFRDAIFRDAISNTLGFTFLLFPLLVIISLGIAILLNQEIRGLAFYRTAVILPAIIAVSLVGVSFQWILNKQWGIVNFLLQNIVSSRFLNFDWFSTTTALPSIAGIFLWKWVGFSTILFIAGLEAIPKCLYEAAKLEGASDWQGFIHITLPNLKGSFVIVGIWSITIALKIFALPFIMTYGGPGTSTLVLYLYAWQNAFKQLEMGYSASICYVLALIVFLFSLLILFFVRTEKQ